MTPPRFALSTFLKQTKHFETLFLNHFFFNFGRKGTLTKSKSFGTLFLTKYWVTKYAQKCTKNTNSLEFPKSDPKDPKKNWGGRVGGHTCFGQGPN